MPTKKSFEYIDYNMSYFVRSIPSAKDFVRTTQLFLGANGWSIEEYKLAKASKGPN